MSGAMLIVLLVVGVWTVVALVVGLALARALGGISHGSEPARPANADDVEHLARSA